MTGQGNWSGGSIGDRSKGLVWGGVGDRLGRPIGGLVQGALSRGPGLGGTGEVGGLGEV